MFLFKNAVIYKESKLQKFDFIVKNDKISKIEPHIKSYDSLETIDLKNQLVCPGLFDIHTHGAMGYDFNMASFDEMKIIMNYYLKNGVTSVLPTIMTDNHQVIHTQLRKLARLSELYPSIKGIHLEGPFLSHKYKGAMPEDALISPDINLFKSFIESSNHLIRYTTIAPELPGASELIAFAKSKGIMVTLGHSDASFNQTLEALNLGANSFTHLFNAMHPLNHHDPGIVGAALYSDAYTEMIMDGKHLEKDTVRLLKKIKSIDRLIIITDSIMATGLKDGYYYLGTNQIKVTDGDARLVSNDTRAGSTLNPFQAILNFSKFTDTSIEETVPLMSVNPARLFNLDSDFGSLEVGKLADFIIIKDNVLKEVYLHGKKI